MIKNILRVLGVGLIGLVAGLTGMLVGALIGGNYFTEVVFNGVRGYEATSQIGLIIGILVGGILGWKLLFKKK